MPLVRIEIIKGKSQKYKELLFQSICNGLTSVLPIPDKNFYQRLYELDEHHIGRSPESGTTDKITFIELYLFPGRNTETKQMIITEITRLLGERLQIPPHDIFIIINEIPLESWGLHGKQASEFIKR